MWSCKSGAFNPLTVKPFKYDNLGCFAIWNGQHGSKRPQSSTIIVASYGRDGYGIWFDSGHNDWSADIKLMMGEYTWNK